jgi:hypothetical protein
MRMVQEPVAMSGDNITNVAGLAALINSRVAAEARVSRAIGFAWLCGGTLIAFTLAGLGLAIAFYGYSYMISVRPAAEQVANALVESLEHAQLKTTVSGAMSLAPNSELTLAPNQVIKVQEGSIVKLDPKSSVRVVGDLKFDMPQPSRQQLQLDTMTRSSELPFTNYTIFKNVDYGGGEVVTGWNFDLSDTARPKSQVCYYNQHVDKGLGIRQTIAINRTPLPPAASTKTKFDFAAALSNCIWFSGA